MVEKILNFFFLNEPLPKPATLNISSRAKALKRTCYIQNIAVKYSSFKWRSRSKNITINPNNLYRLSE